MRVLFNSMIYYTVNVVKSFHRHLTFKEALPENTGAVMVGVYLKNDQKVIFQEDYED